jgi:transcriptional regulator with XRE-family HTH domain
MRLEITSGSRILSVRMRTLGERLRYSRRQRGWTQEQLAAKAGTNQAVIQKIENGKSLRPRKINEIAAVLEVNPAWLMFGEEQGEGLTPEERSFVESWRSLPPVQRERIRSEVIRLAGRRA